MLDRFLNEPKLQSLYVEVFEFEFEFEFSLSLWIIHDDLHTMRMLSANTRSLGFGGGGGGGGDRKKPVRKVLKNNNKNTNGLI